MRIDPFKVHMLATPRGLGRNHALAVAANTTDAVISTLYSGGTVTTLLAKRLARVLGVSDELDLMCSDEDFPARLAKLQEWKAKGSPAQPILGAVVS